MATAGSPPKISGSPNENFNPLADDGELYPDVEESDIENETNSLENSLDNDPSFSEAVTDADARYRYGVTPPANARERKRSKERKKSAKGGPKAAFLPRAEPSQSILRRTRRSSKNSPRTEVVRDSLGDDSVTCDIEINGMDPSDIFKLPNSSEKKRKDSSKSFKSSRSYDRDLKSISNNSLEFGASGSPFVDSTQKFSCLHSRPVPLPGQNNAASLPKVTTDITLPPEKQDKCPPTPQDCPKDRVQFFQIFSTLINLGNPAKKDKEREGKLSRQHSSEQEVWQNRMSDLVWLQVQAWHTGRTIEEEDKYVCKARKNAPAVFEKVFKFNVTPLRDIPAISVVEPESSPTVERRLSGQPSDLSCETPTQNLNSGKYLNEAINKHKVALLQLVEVLEALEDIESLYPTLKAVGKEHAFYASTDFQHRLNTLCLWMNITKDIGHKLQLMAKVLYVDSLKDWPWLDYESPHQILCREPNMLGSVTPDICVTTPLTDEDFQPDWSANNLHIHGEDVLNKNVRFNISDSGPPSPDPDKEFAFGAGDTSTPTKSVQRTSSMMSFDENSKTSMYRYFVDKTLKRTGLMKLLQRLKYLLDGTLQRAKQALERPKLQNEFAPMAARETSASEILSSSPSLDGEAPKHRYTDRRESLLGPGTWSTDFEETGLPSFKPMYLFLVRIPLDVVHECLRLRLEQRPETDPSHLSVRQLIRECKEVLLGAVIVKQWYQQMVNPVVTEEDMNSGIDLEYFEADVQQMLDVYFDYIQTWMNCLQEMPEMSKRLKNFLEEEWNFSKRVCPHVRGGDAKAGNRFCLMASSLLQSISDFLDTGIDECINQLYDSTTAEGIDDSTSDDAHSSAKRSSRSVEVRQAIIQTCRHFKNHFHEARERASKALGFAKMLRKDLEIAADFQIRVSSSTLMAKLNETHHHQVIAPHSSDYLMFVPCHIAKDKEQILQLLNVTCGREDVLNASDVVEEGYLLLVKCEGCVDHPSSCPIWSGAVIDVDPTAETTIALSHIEVDGMLLVVSHSSQLREQTKNFEKSIGHAVGLASEQTSCHQAIAESLAELKNAAIDLRERVAYAITQIDEKLNMEDISEMDESEKYNIQKLYRETLHQCYNFGFEYHKEVIRLVSGERRTNLAHSLVEFAEQWMKFVSEKCERGRGVRPRWASQGLDFLCVACEPRVMATLSEDQYIVLKQCINRCITHVIGDKGTAGNLSPGFRVSSPDPTVQKHGMLRHTSMPDARPNKAPSLRNIHSEPPTPLMETVGLIKKSTSANDSISSEENDMVGRVDIPDFVAGSRETYGEDQRNKYYRLEKIRQKLYLSEKERATKLFQKQVIGRVTEQKVEIDYNISIRRVNFKWQRGIKIGEGQFGKVYTAVNMDTGQMMAVKEIRFAPNDHQTVRDVADEIKLFEGIQHPSLVQYYGVELHRDEMLIFMEYCTEGTIEEVAKQGLTEAMIRRYAMEILVAVKELHDHTIVHRDIKGANIFLTSNGPVKLGDFGCSIKLKSHTTMPGEVNNMVGTTAFMAPEVITRNEGEGSGRGADIWSLGCVVIEMATGKRPWYELENNYQIMFKVGMGAVPPIPDSLSDEGQDFLSHCLEVDCKQRWSASQLQDHPFVKVYSEDEAEVS